jgi:hypothetical protein
MNYFESVMTGICTALVLVSIYMFIRGEVIYRWYQLFLNIAYELDVQAWSEGRMKYSYLEHFSENLISYQQALVSVSVFSKWDCFTNKIVRDTFKAYYEANFK